MRQREGTMRQPAAVPGTARCGGRTGPRGDTATPARTYLAPGPACTAPWMNACESPVACIGRLWSSWGRRGWVSWPAGCRWCCGAGSVSVMPMPGCLAPLRPSATVQSVSGNLQGP